MNDVEKWNLDDIIRYIAIKFNIFEKIVKQRKGPYKDLSNVIDWIDRFLSVWEKIRYKSVFSNVVLSKVAEMKQLKWKLMAELRGKYMLDNIQ